MDQIFNTLKDFEKREDFKEILKSFKGVPVGIIEMEIGDPPIEEMRKEIYKLWESDKITISGWQYKAVRKYEKLLRRYIDNDYWLIFAPLATLSEE